MNDFSGRVSHYHESRVVKDAVSFMILYHFYKEVGQA